MVPFVDEMMMQGYGAILPILPGEPTIYRPIICGLGLNIELKLDLVSLECSVYGYETGSSGRGWIENHRAR